MNTASRLSFLALLVLLTLVPAGAGAHAAEYQVGASTACTLADAIRAANRNESVGGCEAGGEIDVIKVNGNITLTEALPTIRTSMTILSADLAVKPVIDGGRRFPIFDIDKGPHVTLRSLQLVNGYNTGRRGGAVRVLNGNVAIIDVRMEHNWADFGGGALRAGNNGSVSCQGCALVDNASTEGGAIWVGDGGYLLLTDSVVYNNTAARGGGLFVQHGGATLAGNSITNNRAREGDDIFTIDAEIDIRP